MMAATARKPFDVMRDVGNGEELSAVEKTALNFCIEAADEGRQVTRADIAIAIGSENLWGGTAPGVLNRLEQKGYISRTYYQRGLQVCIVETGKCTAAPACQAAHWRHRTEPVPSPTIQAVREKCKARAAVIEAEARAAGKHHQEFLMDLVDNGLELWLERREQQS